MVQLSPNSLQQLANLLTNDALLNGKTQQQDNQGNGSAHLGFEAKLWLAADTATRASANRHCAVTWRDLRAAQDHRSNFTTAL
jgi:hypothetical protein